MRAALLQHHNKMARVSITVLVECHAASMGGTWKLVIFVLAFSLVAPQRTGAANADGEVRATIQKFIGSFNDGFRDPADYATEDWNHINPNGGRTEGPGRNTQEGP